MFFRGLGRVAEYLRSYATLIADPDGALKTEVTRTRLSKVHKKRRKLQGRGRRPYNRGGNVMAANGGIVMTLNVASKEKEEEVEVGVKANA